MQLELAGWVASEQDTSTRGRVGRPASVFQLTVEGEGLFPEQDQTLLLSMLDALTGLGPAALKALLARVADDQVAGWGAQAGREDGGAEGPGVDRALHGGRRLHGAARDGGDLLLIEKNCPYLEVALKRPALCSVSVNVLARLLNAQVVREERFQEGHRRAACSGSNGAPVGRRASAWRSRGSER